MAGDRSEAIEALGDDPHREVPGAASRAGMARVEVAVVLDRKLGRREAVLEQRPDCGYALAHVHGRALT